MKKNLLFVIDSLVAAGAEKSLITLLSLLDFNKYNVDLMLFGHGEILEKLVPKEVNVLQPLKYTEFTNKTLKDSFYLSLKNFKFKMFISRIKYSFEIRRKNYSNAEKARIFWESVSKVIENNPKTYDVAISYAQGIPTFYVAEKIKAKKKFAWVNVSYRLGEKDREFQRGFYEQYNRIVAVSDSAKEIFIETFPYFAKKVEVIYDINDPNFIFKMSQIGRSYNDDFSGIRILTIGRLAFQKGYDIALDVCKKLKQSGINFRWYVLGKGPLKNEIEQYIKENDLTKNFILLGVTDNPYPYIRDCDLYVQTSRFEGFGLAIAEARMLNKPVITTRFDAVYNQMIEGKNGMVVDINSDDICKGIKKLITDHELKENIVRYLQNEKKGNVEEIEKFYQLIS